MAFADPCLEWRPLRPLCEDGTVALEDSQWIRRCPIRHGRGDSVDGSRKLTSFVSLVVSREYWDAAEVRSLMR
jgi:hypothetical protein